MLLASAVLCLVVWQAALRRGVQRIETELGDRLTVSVRAVESEIERFRYLPAVAAQDARIPLLLQAPGAGAAAAANRYLETLRRLSGVDQIYLLDRNGVTLAASNWTEPGSFVGHDYSFRPYFRDAIERGEGRFYGIGVTTGKPGYFLSTRVDGPDGPIGVVVTKVDMAQLEETWAEAGEMTGIADDAGIIFLAGDPSWRYRPLYPLSDQARAVLAAERRYDKLDVAAPPALAPRPLPAAATIRIAGEDGGWMVGNRVLERDGWQIVSALPVRPVQQDAWLIATLAALTSLLAFAVAFSYWQSRQLTRMKLEQNAVLEQRVAERTEALAREIDVRRQAEAELRRTHDSLVHAARLAALGRMSAAIVHEISQPLAALDSRLATAGLHAERNAMTEVRRNLASGRDLLARMTRTVKDLRSFSSRQEPVPAEPVDLARVLEAACNIVAARAAEGGVRVDVRGLGGLSAVSGNPIRLEQVFINLLLNAIDATRSAGNDRVWITGRAAAGSVIVEIGDTGGGIPPELRARIGEPFFTTKTTGEGLGLGLSITLGILEQHGASLSFAANPEGGTCARVEFAPNSLAGRSERVA